MNSKEVSNYLNDNYPHINFNKNFSLSEKVLLYFGHCESMVKLISEFPLQPKYRKKLLGISLIKGAQATTAIEGNTLSYEEVKKVEEGISLPESKEYQEQEVKNIIEALNNIINSVIFKKEYPLISSELLKEYHFSVGNGIKKNFDAIPGKFRENNVVVASYRPPDYKYIDKIIELMCEWLRKDFHFENGQSFKMSTLEAIIVHIYIAWIHPFGDGNGRTARLLETYILLRGGVPFIVSYILSNHYNETRTEYYRQLSFAAKKNDLTEFIDYAITGFRDGLSIVMEEYKNNLFEVTWHKYIYDRFDTIQFRNITFKRRRRLILSMPVNKTYNPEELINSGVEIAKMYAGTNIRTIKRDLKFLETMGLVKKEKGKFRALIEILQPMVIPKKR